MGLSDAIKGRVKKQVEFYFSDSNVPRDVFLISKIKEDPDGFVDLQLICTFTRMMEALGISREKGKAGITPEIVSQVAEVLRGSDAVVVSEDGQRIRRTQPLTSVEEMAKAVDARSLYAAPFPFDATLDSIEAYFAGVAPVNAVRLRRHMASKDFRGSVFVEFASREVAEEVLGKSLDHEGAPLTLEWKMDYVQRKEAQRKGQAQSRADAQADISSAPEGDFFAEPAAGDQEANGRGAVPAVENGGAAAAVVPAGDTDAAAAPAAAQAPEEDEAVPVAGGAKGEQEAQEEEVRQFVPGLLLRFDFGDATHDLSYEDIKAAFRPVAFVEFQKGASSGILRFKNKEDADQGLSKGDAEGNVSVEGVTATVTKLEGKEEAAFYKRAAAARRPEGSMQKRRKYQPKRPRQGGDEEGGGGRGGGGRKGRGGSRGKRGRQ